MKYLLLLLPILSSANPNTNTYQMKLGAKVLTQNELKVNYNADFVLEYNAMEERCFFKLKDSRQIRAKNKAWDCRFRTQKEEPNLAYKGFLKLFEESYKIIHNKELMSLEAFHSDSVDIYFNGKVTKQTYLKLLPGQYEISFRDTGKKGLSLTKLSLKIY